MFLFPVWTASWPEIENSKEAKRWCYLLQQGHDRHAEDSLVGLTGVFASGQLFVWHHAFLVQEAPFKDAAVVTGVVHRVVAHVVPVDSIHDGHRQDSPKHKPICISQG